MEVTSQETTDLTLLPYTAFCRKDGDQKPDKEIVEAVKENKIAHSGMLDEREGGGEEYQGPQKDR